LVYGAASASNNNIGDQLQVERRDKNGWLDLPFKIEDAEDAVFAALRKTFFSVEDLGQ